MLLLREMARRRQSNDVALFEAACGLAAMFVLGWMFSPPFRALIILIVGVVVAISLLSLLIWMIYSSVKSKPSLSSFRTAGQYYRTADSPNFRPPTIGMEMMQLVEPTPELTISEKLRKLDWFQFEKLMELIYQQRGFSVRRLGGAKPDGGVDLIIKSATEEFVVQCKHWRKWTVGVRHIREFLGTLTDCKISKGIFVTLVGYSGEAKQLADKHGIQILDESDIVVMLVESGLMYSKEISTLFSDQRKFCPKCENEMVIRTARVKRNRFWGCSKYPDCRYILNFEG